MKHRDVETADETLQLILGLLPMNSRPPSLTLSCVSPGCWDLFLCAAPAGPIVPHLTLPISHPWPKTLPFFFLSLLNSPSPETLIRRSRKPPPLSSSRCYSTAQPVRDSPSALWQQSSRHSDHFNAIVPWGAAPPRVSKPCVPEGWILEEQRAGHNLNLTPPSPLRCVCPQIHNRSRHSVKQYKANAIHHKRESEAISSSGCVFYPGRPLWEWVNPLHYCFKRWQALVQQQRL